MIRSFTSGHPGCALLVCSLAALSAVPIHAAGAQGLYQPRPVRRAFAQGTRAPDGRPGPGYWQNHARYTMTLAAAPPNRTVTGTRADRLRQQQPGHAAQLVIQLIVNIHKPGAPRDRRRERRTTSRRACTSTRSRSTARRRPWTRRDGLHRASAVNAAGAAAAARLGAPRRSTGTTTSRRRAAAKGMIDSTTFFLAYFYPRVSPCTTTTTAGTRWPSPTRRSSTATSTTTTSRVQGAGQLRRVGHGHAGATPAEVLQPATLAALPGVAHVGPDDPRRDARRHAGAKRVTAQQPMNAWHFTAPNMPDMAFALSDHYVWDAGERRGRRRGAPARERAGGVQRHRGRLPSHGALRPSRARLALAQLAGRAVSRTRRRRSSQGFAGMEYPMMANDESYADTTFSRFVAEHEIAHTYFPFYMGINETRYAFMDEGLGDDVRVSDRRRRHGQGAGGRVLPAVPRATAGSTIRRRCEDLPIITPEDVLQRATATTPTASPRSATWRSRTCSATRCSARRCTPTWTAGTASIRIPWDFFNTFNDVDGPRT